MVLIKLDVCDKCCISVGIKSERPHCEKNYMTLNLSDYFVKYFWISRSVKTRFHFMKWLFFYEKIDFTKLLRHKYIMLEFIV